MMHGRVGAQGLVLMLVVAHPGLGWTQGTLPSADTAIELAVIRGDWEQVLHLADLWRQREPRGHLSAYLAGEAHSRLGQPERMLQAWEPVERASVWQPDTLRPLVVWADGFARRHDRSAAAWVILSNLLIFSNDGLGGVRAAERAVSVARDDPWCYLNRSSAYFNVGDQDAAIRDATTVLAMNPRSAEAHVVRAWARDAKGDAQGALADLSQALELAPAYALAHYGRGLVYLRAGEPDEALADLSAAVDLEPWYGWFHYDRALVHYRNGDYDAAVEDLTAYLAQYPWEPMAHFRKGRACQRSGRTEEAIEAFREFIRLAPGAGLGWRVPEARARLRELGVSE